MSIRRVLADVIAAAECRTGLAPQGTLVSEGAFAQGPFRCSCSKGRIQVNNASVWL